jgi:hypothetical protein
MVDVTFVYVSPLRGVRKGPRSPPLHFLSHGTGNGKENFQGLACIDLK